MWKFLIVFVVLANISVITSCKDNCKCNDNEVYSNCTNGGCGPKYCSQLGMKVGCVEIDKTLCKKGYICKKGYLRNEKGKCIPVKDCPECGGDPNAEAGCGVNCGRHCSDYNKGPVSCIAICYEDACDCKKDFVLDDYTGKCVLPKNCTPTCAVNEVYDSCANGGCRRRYCSQSTVCVRPKKCEGGCICQDDYTRAKNGICIPEDDCPEAQCNDDERYEECPDNLCTPQNCSQLGFPINCPASSGNSSSACPGKPGCVCDDETVRGPKGNCIPKDQCPSCGGDPHAVSGCGINCGRLCSNYKAKNVFCPRICKFNACDCKKEFVFDTNLQKCVYPKDCTPTCGNNEVYNTCANGGCRRRKCSEPIICVDPIKCEEGCVCQKKYTRAKNGTCIPEDQCPKTQCPDGERYEECPDNLCTPQNCSQLGFPISCPASSGNPSSACPGKPGCVCENNCVRGPKGKCIPKDQCPSCGGDPNAVSGCGVNCGRLCSNYKQKNVACPAICNTNGCDCKKGLVYDSNLHKCVDPKDCTPTCAVNEVYDSCANGGCRRRYCSQSIVCVRPKKCEGGCICQDDYTRAKNGTCIPEDDCPEAQCNDDERYEECPDNLCTPQNCSQLGFPINCPASSGNSSSACPGKPGCVCDDDNVRDSKGNCIPKDQCPSCGGDPNAKSGCGVNCGRLCSNYKQKNVICPLICNTNGCDCKKDFVYDSNLKKCVDPKDCTPTCAVNEVYDNCANGGCRRRKCSEDIICVDPIKCEGGCVCRDKFTRASNGTCIPENQCPKLECNKPNEYRDDCPKTCPPQTCEIIGKECDYKCPIEPAVCRKPACRCIKGYYRNKKGECISKEDCKRCTGPHEYFACGVACDNECKFRNKQNQTNCPIVNVKCNPKCYCEKDYYRDNNGICIPVDQCPPLCPDGERYEECPDNLCTPQNCSQLGFPISCPALSGNSSSACPGKPGCVCDDNTVRGPKGKCIPRDQCPSCGGDPNAESGCGVNCGRLCSNYKQKNVVCPLICNTNGCDCKKGFVYDSNLKKCVNPKDCTPTCAVNEVYNTCANGGCRRRKCSEGIICVDPIKCEGGCVCRDKYTRASNGTCIPENQCPKLECNKPNEYRDDCPKTCPPQTCEIIGKECDYKCPIEPAVCREPACRCVKGYYRNKKGECISKEDCKRCTGPHEYFSCGVACDNECKFRNKQNQTNCPIVNVNCNPMCYCEKDYYRDCDGICIPVDQCPPPICADDEKYEECPDNLCIPLTCSQLGYPIDCSDSSDECPGEPGCICDYGYVRNDKGKCIPKNKCPSCGGDPNAEVGCGSNCGRKCSDYMKKNVACPLSCILNGCDCKDGFVYDEIAKKCVRPKDCCKKN